MRRIDWFGGLLLTACQVQATVIPVAGRPDDTGEDDTGEDDTGTERIDADKDGFFRDEDCDDADPAINPAAEERCDLVDHDCDGEPIEPGACPCDDVQVLDGLLIVVCREFATWEEGAEFCAQDGLDLAIADSSSVNVWIAKLVNELSVGPAWIGATDQEREGTWRWSDGSRVSWDSWGAGEPNDFGRGEDCAQLFPWDGTWNDTRCDTQLPFVCTWTPE